MLVVHEFIAEHGVDEARKLAKTKFDKQCVDMAAALLAGPKNELVYGGLAVTSPLQRRLFSGDDEIHLHTRRIAPFEYRLERGSHPLLGSLGLPYGPIARLIMLDIYDRVLRSGKRRFETVETKYALMQRIGLNVGGKTYKAWLTQGMRTMCCRIGISRAGHPEGRPETMPMYESLESIAPNRFAITVNRDFFRHITEEFAVLDLAALRHISHHCWAIDMYAWLNYALPRLKQPLTRGWDEFVHQFGMKYSNPAQLSVRARAALQMALAVYPAARVRLEGPRITLYPAPDIPLPTSDRP